MQFSSQLEINVNNNIFFLSSLLLPLIFFFGDQILLEKYIN